MAEWNEFLCFEFNDIEQTPKTAQLGIWNNEPASGRVWYFSTLTAAKTTSIVKWDISQFEQSYNGLTKPVLEYGKKATLYLVTTLDTKLASAVTLKFPWKWRFENREGIPLSNGEFDSLYIELDNNNTLEKVDFRFPLTGEENYGLMQIWKLSFYPEPQLFPDYLINQLTTYKYIKLQNDITTENYNRLKLEYTYYNNWSTDYLKQSSQVLCRTSDGNRFNENILPSLTETTVDVPGRHGQHWFNTRFKNRQITIKFAFTGITEQDIEDMRDAFNGLEIKKLKIDTIQGIKEYQAKVTGTPSLKVVPFGKHNERTYNGEGTI